MNQILFALLSIKKDIKSFFNILLFKYMFHSYGSVGVNNYYKIIRVSIVDVGSKFSLNGLTISGFGSVKIGDYFHSGSNCKIIRKPYYNHG